MEILKSLECTISKKEVLKRLHYFQHTMTLNSRIEQQIDQGIDEGYIFMEPKAVFETYNVDKKDGCYIISEIDYVIESKLLLKHLGIIDKITLFVCTIGNGLPERVGTLLGQKKIGDAAILDAVGSAAIEGVADRVNTIIQKEARLKGYQLRSRFSPGYGDWRITEQRALLHALQSEQIDVSLTDACVMVPEKSISAIIGWWK